MVHQGAVDVPEHSHELAYFTFVLKGGYAEKFAGQYFQHRPLSILWHRAGISHKDRIGAGGGRFFTVEIQPPGLENLSQFAKIPEDFFERDGQLGWLAFRLYREFRNWQACSSLVAEGIALEMLGFAARKQLPSEKHQPAWLLRIIEKLKHEFAENFSTRELAAEAGVHPVYLSTVFRRFYKETIAEYVRKLRIAHAARLLPDKEIPLAEIAHSAGFADQSHFTRVFKHFTGMTPGAFRDSLD